MQFWAHAVAQLAAIDPKFQEAIMREVVDDSPGVAWSDIVGLEEAKETLREAAIFPLLRPDVRSEQKENNLKLTCIQFDDSFTLAFELLQKEFCYLDHRELENQCWPKVHSTLWIVLILIFFYFFL